MHFHDSVYLACKCPDTHPNCQEAIQFVDELEALYHDLTWKNTDIPVFKFGKIEWTMEESFS